MDKLRNATTIETEFFHSYAIVSSLSDLMTSLEYERFDELDSRVIDQANYSIFEETQKLHTLFQELLTLHLQATKAKQPIKTKPV